MYARLIDRVRPDIVHSHHVTTTLTLRLAMGRDNALPRIFQVPGPLHLEHWPSRNIEIATAGPNDFWIASSEYIQRLYQNAGVSSTKLFRSYHSTDSRIFSLWRTGYLRARLNIPSDARIVGNINLIYPPKRFLGHTIGLKCHEDVIEAISIVQKARRDVWGVLIGGTFSGSLRYEEKLRAMAERVGAGKILMPGKFDASQVLMSWPDFDCAIHVPISENCGGVVEPLLCGVPTIAGNVGGLPEVVKPGVTGRLVPVREPKELAEAILAVLENYAAEKKKALFGRKLVAAAFSPRRCADEVLSIYRHILMGSPRPHEFSTQRFVELESISCGMPEPVTA